MTCSIARKVAFVAVLILAVVALDRLGQWWSRRNGVTHQAVLRDDLAFVRDHIRDAKEATAGLFYARSGAMAELLISKGADVHAINGEYNCTPLHFAAGLGAADVVAVLLRNGAEVQVRNSSSETPLHWATMHIVNIDTGFDESGWLRTPERKLETARILVDRGADVNARDTYGRTPLFDATWAGADLVSFLLAAGADARVRTSDRHTVLHDAARACDGDKGIDVVLLLLKHGADAYARDWQGKTSGIEHNEKVIEFLRAHGGPSNSAPSVVTPR